MNKIIKKINSDKKNKVILLSPLSLIMLSACGGGSSGTSSGQEQSFSGFVVKGPLQNATVLLIMMVMVAKIVMNHLL